MKKVLFKNEATRIEQRNKKLMVVAYSPYKGETKTYYITPTKDFNFETDYESNWNEHTKTYSALLYHIRNQDLNCSTIKDYAVI